ncbi:TRAP transporter small permease subunit [Ramlibacter sp. MAH-25]|uniref:TRAP transporter small permease protein n=1 Tax=Ramlibacter pinisoli TaxID=2682844 RepID=A0A6N8IYA8_9BURK|nr:TRAP transporter small permease [Ramlibacter sp. CGMCC 1.13660]MVQ31999.1 TRAP transporter small permease subunit [Ramlibacter pinisoli]
MDRWLARAVEGVLAFLMLGMVLMVFGNVVLRYAFNSGILFSEEMSRVFFVWMTFVGAIVAVREGTHLGMDNVVQRLPRAGKVLCLAASQLLVLACCAILFWGTWRQHEVNASMRAPVTGLSLIWVFGLGYVCSVAIGGLTLASLWRLARGQMAEAELVQVRETDEPAVGASA